MTRVDELQRKYPDLPREIIIKWESLTQGIRDSEVVDKVAVWDRGGSYQSRDHDVTLKQIAAKRPGTVKRGFVMRTDPFYMKNGIGVGVSRNSRSPYEFREQGEGKFALYEEDEKVEDIYFEGPKPRNMEAVTSRGTPVTSLVSGVGRCFRVFPVRYCEYFNHGEQCKFCNYNSTYDDMRSLGNSPLITISLDDTIEAYKIASSHVRFVEGRFQMGAFRSVEQEARVYGDFVEQIAKGASYTPHMAISTQPMDRKGMQRLKEVGLSCLEFNVEVWGAELFEEICPGKATYRGFDRYKESYVEAVDVFGAGRVACNFVAGASMMPANGHRTWQEARDAEIEGFRWLIKNGVFPTFIALRLGVGSIYGDDESSQRKLPPIDYYLELAIAHHRLMLEYGLYDKLDRLMFCPLDCPPNIYCGEVGMIALAGDVGNWAAQCVPGDANWLARFIASVGSPAKA